MLTTKLKTLSSVYAACVQGMDKCADFSSARDALNVQTSQTEDAAEQVEPQLHSEFAALEMDFDGALGRLDDMHAMCTATPLHCTSAAEFQHEVMSILYKYEDKLAKLQPDAVFQQRLAAEKFFLSFLTFKLHGMSKSYAACVTQGKDDLKCTEFTVARRAVETKSQAAEEQAEQIEAQLHAEIAAVKTDFEGELAKLDDIHDKCISTPPDCASASEFHSAVTTTLDQYEEKLTQLQPAIAKELTALLQRRMAATRAGLEPMTMLLSVDNKPNIKPPPPTGTKPVRVK